MPWCNEQLIILAVIWNIQEFVLRDICYHH